MSKNQPRQMKLINLAHTGQHVAGWRHPKAATDGLHSLAVHQRMAALTERGKFDAIFIADRSGFTNISGRDAFCRTDNIRIDPMSLLCALAATTTNLGLVATASTLNPPFSVARQFAALDHLSSGRAGWNIVTSSSEHEAHNFGLANNYGHDERYERATEFVEIAIALWDAVEDGAVVMNKATGQYLDPDKIHGVNYKGRFYSVAGPLNVQRPPQGRPVLFQAGASPAGRALSARFAEAVFTSAPTLESARDSYAKTKAMVASVGRSADSIKVFPAFKPILGSTETEAQKLLTELNESIHIDTALSILGTYIGGFDLTAYDLDGPVPDLPKTEKIQSTQDELIAWARRDNLTIRQLAQKFAGQRTGGLTVGTPEQVADTMEDWFRHGAADGFAVVAAYLPGQFEVFVDEVVPILQRRGLFRQAYEGATLRENLGLTRPDNMYAGHPERHSEPEVWL